MNIKTVLHLRIVKEDDYWFQFFWSSGLLSFMRKVLARTTIWYFSKYSMVGRNRLCTYIWILSHFVYPYWYSRTGATIMFLKTSLEVSVIYLIIVREIAIVGQDRDDIRDRDHVIADDGHAPESAGEEARHGHFFSFLTKSFFKNFVQLDSWADAEKKIKLGNFFIVGHDLVCLIIVIVAGSLHHGDVHHLVDHVCQDPKDAMCKFLKFHTVNHQLSLVHGGAGALICFGFYFLRSIKSWIF